MSQMSTEKVKCPHCGQETTVEIWPSINVTLMPEVKQDVLNGSCFIASCDVCGKEFPIEYSTLYHDMDKKLMIHCNGYLPPQMRTMLQMAMSEDFETGHPMMEGYTHRFVVCINDLREKILIADLGYDDRIIEIMKMIIAGALSEPDFYLLVEHHLLPHDDGTVDFAFYLQDGRVAHSEFSEELYEFIQKNFADELNAETETMIDAEWAEEFIINHLDDFQNL